jgi:hypothetical protein
LPLVEEMRCTSRAFQSLLERAQTGGKRQSL